MYMLSYQYHNTNYFLFYFNFYKKTQAIISESKNCATKFNPPFQIFCYQSPSYILGIIVIYYAHVSFVCVYFIFYIFVSFAIRNNIYVNRLADF